MASVAVHRPDHGARPGPPVVTLSLAPLGVPMRIELAGTHAAEALSAACPRWPGTADAAPVLSLSIALAGSGEAPAAVRIDVEGTVMTLRGHGVEGTADHATGQAACRVPAGYLALPDRLRTDILDPLVLFLLGHNDRAPVHASCFVAGELAVLLAGPSGSGKSCLAHAADAAGFPVLSEDVVYVQRWPHLTVWGWPGPLHLLPANAPPGREFATRVRNGKSKLAVPLARPETSGSLSALRAAFCLLRRGGEVALERISTAEALAALARLEPGFDLMAEEVRAAHAALARNGAWRLTLSEDPAEAIRFLAARLALLRDCAVP